jgi:probable F420-dependent oxidoreductase
MAKIKFGFFYDFRNPPQWARPWPEVYAETLDFISLTESLGYDGAWIAEHHAAADGYIPSPLITAAAIAARTTRITIGTALVIAPLYQPVRFAEDCAVIDILSNGRLEIGLGVGWRRSETDAAGVSFTTRGAYTDEFIHVVRRLWRGEEVTFHGKHIHVEKAVVMPRPVQKHIPLLIGGFSPKALQRAAQDGDGYLGVTDLYPAYIDEVRACGKDPASARFAQLHMSFYVARDPEKALREIGPHALYTNDAYAKWQNDAQYQSPDAHSAYLSPMTLQELQQSGKLMILTPAQAITHLQQQLAVTPIDTFMTLALPGGFPRAKFAEYAELFAKEVMPAFR